MDEKNKLYNLIQNIATQHSYDDYTRNMLLATVPPMIEYYGEEYQEHILNVISNVKIAFVNTPDEMLSEMKGIEQPNVNKGTEGEIVTDADVRIASGVYASEPVLNYKDGNITIDDVRRVVVVKKHDGDGIRLTMSTFVHELSHAIKAFKNEYTICKNENGKQVLTRRNGVIREEQELEYDGSKIIRNSGSETGVGIEEGQNTLDEENITNRIIGRKINIESNADLSQQVNNLVQACGEEKYEAKGYMTEKIIMQQMGELLEGYDSKKDTIEGKNTLMCDIENKLGVGTYSKFSHLLDELVGNFYNRMKSPPFEYDFSDGKMEIIGYTDKFLENVSSRYRILMQVNWFRDTLNGVKYEKNLSPAIMQALYSRILIRQKMPGGQTFYKLNALEKKTEIYMNSQMLEKHFTNEDGTFNFERLLDFDNPYTPSTWKDLGTDVRETVSRNGNRREIICSIETNNDRKNQEVDTDEI